MIPGTMRPSEAELPDDAVESALEDDDDDTESDNEPFLKTQGRQLLKVDLTAIFLVYIVNFLDSLGGSISTPILPFYAAEFHANYTEVGYLFSTFAMAQVVSMPFLSYLSDRYGRKKVLLLATFGTGLGGLWQATATSYHSLLASRVFSGLWAGVASVCQVYIVDVVPPDLRADYISYLNSSTQASTLFGPSIGAGLSALGINVPVFVQGCVSLVLCIIVWGHLTESPEWCRLHSPESPMTPTMTGTVRKRRSVKGMGRNNIVSVILAYGSMSLCCMVSQMSIMSMFAVYAERTYALNSVEVGFTMTLGALSSVGTNIWISPPVLKKIGTLNSSLLGFALIAVGSVLVTVQPYWVSVLGLMIAYQGLAINSSAVATGAANRTDQGSRATIMTGSRMFKSAGAVVGPIVSGPLATRDVRLPFIVAGIFSLGGIMAQLVSLRKMRAVSQLLKQRRVIGNETALLEGEWLDEYGTEEEIADLGNFVATLLTKRHYRWVTYNKELKNFIADSFPNVSCESEEKHRKEYDARRRLVKEQQNQDYQTICDEYKNVCLNNMDLQKEIRMLRTRLGDKNPRAGGGDVERRVSQMQFRDGLSGLGQ